MLTLWKLLNAEKEQRVKKKRCLGRNVSLIVTDLILWPGGKGVGEEIIFPLFSFQNMKKQIQKQITVLVCFTLLSFSGFAVAVSFPPTSINTGMQGKSSTNSLCFSLD